MSEFRAHIDLAGLVHATTPISNAELSVVRAYLPQPVNPGMVLRLVAAGVMTNGTTASTSTVRARVGSDTAAITARTVIASTVVNNVITTRTNMQAWMEAFVRIVSIGAAATAIGGVELRGGSAGTAPGSGMTAPATFDSRFNNNLIELTFQSSLAAVTFTPTIGHIQVLKAA